MPVYQDNYGNRGDIVLKFKVQMPLYLPIINKEMCETYLKKTN